jgi:hypothetical protein
LNIFTINCDKKAGLSSNRFSGDSKPMLYEKCAEVSEEFWRELRQADPETVTRRTGAIFSDNCYRLSFLNRELRVDVAAQQIVVSGAEDVEPGFRLCLTALLYLLKVDTAALGQLVSPLSLTGGTTFFQQSGPHALPNKPLEERFGSDPAGFLAAGQRLGAEIRPAGDGALALRVFPGLSVEVILWQADEEFPAQVSFAVPANLERFWHLDAVLGLLEVVAQELLQAAGPPA